MDFIRWIFELHNPEYLQHIVSQGGVAIVTFIIYAETGLLAGFFLPGDSLLITAGLLSSTTAFGGTPLLSLSSLIGFVTLAAIAGDQSGFWLGRTSGKAVEQKSNRRIHKFLNEAKSFFADFGNRAVIYARFIPIMRTFVPFAAGLSGMTYKKYFTLSVGSGILWVPSMVLIGHFLGKTSLADQIHKIVMLVIFISVVPVFVTIAKRYFFKRK